MDKPGKLDEEEWAAVRSHAMFTENILSRIDALSELARVAGAHHERLDGNGNGYALLPELIPSVRARYPQMELELTEATSAEILDGLVSRRFDAGLVRYPVLQPSAFQISPLDRDEFVLAVSDGSPLAAKGATQGDSIALSAAAQKPFIMYPHDKVPNLCALAMMRSQASGFTPRVEQEAMQVQTIMSLVASGLGVGLVASVARWVMPRGVKCLTLTDNPPGFHVGIALARLAGATSRIVERFSEHVLQFSAKAHARQLIADADEEPSGTDPQPA